jgi:DNA-directed RNA polymerase subunit RPC12/RpoP
MRRDEASTVVDGNAVAGLLTELFETDASMLIGVCGECGASAPLAETVVELDERAAIVRCRTCTHTLFTVLRSGDAVRLRLASLRELVRR